MAKHGDKGNHLLALVCPHQVYVPLFLFRHVAYQYCCFKEEVCGSPMRLLVLESTSLKEKAAASLEKKRQELEPEIKKGTLLISTMHEAFCRYSSTS